MRTCMIAAVLLVTGPLVAAAQEAPRRVVTLEQASASARERQPQLRQARATTAAAEARADQALAPYLPQVSGSAAYQRATANYVTRPGSLPSGVTPASHAASLSTFNSFSFGLTASQLVYDFGVTSGRYEAARATARAQELSERSAILQVDLAVRLAYFTARATKALVTVARETYANQERHLESIQAFVNVGTRPDIDLAQGRADLATARVQVINAENGYETAKAQLNQAMGVEQSTDYDVADEMLQPVPGEGQSTGALVDEALRLRPELAVLAEQARAAGLTLRSLRGGYWPSVGVSTGATEAGSALSNLTWNLAAGVTLSWSFYEGGLTSAQVREAEANRVILSAEVEALRLQVRLQIDQARLGVRAAVGALAAADEALTNARERLRLAEGRYEAGVGNIIELGDAQLALTSAEAQRVQAEFNLSSARAQLLQALGRP